MFNQTHLLTTLQSFGPANFGNAGVSVVVRLLIVVGFFFLWRYVVKQTTNAIRQRLAAVYETGMGEVLTGSYGNFVTKALDPFSQPAPLPACDTWSSSVVLRVLFLGEWFLTVLERMLNDSEGVIDDVYYHLLFEVGFPAVCYMFLHSTALYILALCLGVNIFVEYCFICAVLCFAIVLSFMVGNKFVRFIFRRFLRIYATQIAAIRAARASIVRLNEAIRERSERESTAAIYEWVQEHSETVNFFTNLSVLATILFVDTNEARKWQFALTVFRLTFFPPVARKRQAGDDDDLVEIVPDQSVPDLAHERQQMPMREEINNIADNVIAEQIKHGGSDEVTLDACGTHTLWYSIFLFFFGSCLMAKVFVQRLWSELVIGLIVARLSRSYDYATFNTLIGNHIKWVEKWLGVDLNLVDKDRRKYITSGIARYYDLALLFTIGFTLAAAHRFYAARTTEAKQKIGKQRYQRRTHVPVTSHKRKRIMSYDADDVEEALDEMGATEITLTNGSGQQIVVKRHITGGFPELHSANLRDFRPSSFKVDPLMREPWLRGDEQGDFVTYRIKARGSSYESSDRSINTKALDDRARNSLVECHEEGGGRVWQGHFVRVDNTKTVLTTPNHEKSRFKTFTYGGKVYSPKELLSCDTKHDFAVWSLPKMTFTGRLLRVDDFADLKKDGRFSGCLLNISQVDRTVGHTPCTIIVSSGEISHTASTINGDCGALLICNDKTAFDDQNAQAKIVAHHIFAGGANQHNGALSLHRALTMVQVGSLAGSGLPAAGKSEASSGSSSSSPN